MFICSSSISSGKDVKKFINEALPGLNFPGKFGENTPGANSGKRTQNRYPDKNS